MEEDKILVPASILRDIEYKIIEIKSMNYNSEVGEKLDELLSYIDSNIFGESVNRDVLADLVYNKMKEVKYKNQDLNSMLYILYKNIKNNRITTDKALEMFNMYVKLDEF